MQNANAAGANWKGPFTSLSAAQSNSIVGDLMAASERRKRNRCFHKALALAAFTKKKGEWKKEDLLARTLKEFTRKSLCVTF